MESNVSIIMPLYKPNEVLLRCVQDMLDQQHYDGEVETLTIEEGLGLAASINYGVKQAKYDIIVTLHQDCIPASNDWLHKLVEPLKDPMTVASCSDIFDLEQKNVYTPGLDGKGCAYKKKALLEVGLFDDKTFLNSGEDVDMYEKLKKIGNIDYPHCIINHDHPGYLTAKGYKKLQNANSWGCLIRRYGTSLEGWWKPVVLANIFNIKYCYWFWRGFILKKQDWKR